MKSALLTTSLHTLPLFSRGKVRDNYFVEPDKLLMIATDRLSAFDVVMNEPIPEKGKILTKLTLFWFETLKHIIPNHLTGEDPAQVVDPSEREQVTDRSMVVKRLHPIPIEAVVRGYLAGSAFLEYERSGLVCGIILPTGLTNSSKLTNPIFTPATKASGGSHDENISFQQMIDIVGIELSLRIRDISIKLYSSACEIAFAKGIIIADTKFEFGLDSDNNLILMDEILTPDSSRFWSTDEYKEGCNPPSFDKQFVRDWLELPSSDGNRWNKQPPAPKLSEEVVNKTYQKYAEAVRRITA